MTVELLIRQRVQSRQRRALVTGLRSQPGKWPAPTGSGVGPECSCDGQRLVVAGTSYLQHRPDFADRIRPERREGVRQRSIDLNPVCCNVIGAPLPNSGPGFAGGPRVRRRNVVGLREGGGPPALAEVVGEPTRGDLGGLVQRNSRRTGL